MKVYKILIAIILCFPNETRAQDWPKIYGGNTNNWCWELKEFYDKGYIIDVQVDPGLHVPQMYAWFIKTDMNGNQLWSKTISSNAYQVALNGLDNTSDGGFIVTGATTKLDPSNYDIVFIKFNACGEKEWCNIISTPGNDDNGVKIKSVPNGYIALIHYFKDWQTKRIWLFKLDLSGEILWQQCYLDSANVVGEEPEDLLVCSDSGYLITGDGYFPPSEQKTYYLMPLFIKTSSDGAQQWVLAYGQTNGFRGDIPQYTNENQTGFYYSSGRDFRQTAPYGDSPCFLKVSPTGQAVYSKDLISNSQLGGASTLLLKNNDSLYITATWKDLNNIFNVGIFKLDTVGNISKTKIVIQNVIYYLMSSLFTYNNNYLTAGNFNPDSTNTRIYLYKFTSNLDSAPLNTQPRVYDSLCLNPIVSDTTNLDDCAVISGIDDPFKNPEKFNLIIYPNPARDKLAIEIPEKLKRQTSSGSIQVTTIYHQWSSAILEIFDLFGKRIYSKEISNQTEIVQMDVSSWNDGMYEARLVFMNQVVAGAKFVVLRL